MRLLIVRDRKPGHFHQTEGLARLIAARVPAEIDRLPVKPRRLAHSFVRRAALRWFGKDPAVWLERLYGVDVSAVAKPDVILASGRPTIAAGIFLARHFGADLVYTGRATGYDRADFRLMLVPFPRYAAEPRSTYSPIPCMIDPDALPTPKPLKTEADLKGARIALLLGGKSHGHTFRADEWRAVVRFVEESAAALGIRWSVSTSRRTPTEVADLFAGQAARGVLDSFIDYRSAGAGSANALFALDAIVVTEDSLSMITEAVTARRPVIALKPDRVEASMNDEAVAMMYARGAVSVLPLASLSPGLFSRELTRLTPDSHDIREEIWSAIAPVVTGRR
ncbi:ELM1/GtrOC1 family putative glycosyltransferase [Chthonobacter rhizosphaerae]|uniref:ELM1/GtrOC1 family putative glycosyltransferase n=1 Tax=Chthonobacter rhizosphaerae TaxID=2735553 RepID=UPI0015EF57E3|nr:ELM1/GtrOC1 family putative glycosyltransferase [Chthonobacter rhizosphaerae]